MIDGSSGTRESIFHFCKSLKAKLLPPPLPSPPGHGSRRMPPGAPRDAIARNARHPHHHSPLTASARALLRAQPQRFSAGLNICHARETGKGPTSRHPKSISSCQRRSSPLNWALEKEVEEKKRERRMEKGRMGTSVSSPSGMAPAAETGGGCAWCFGDQRVWAYFFQRTTRQDKI